MTEELDEKEIVNFQELLMSQLTQLDAVTQLLIEKGIITEKEFVVKLKHVQGEYQGRRAAKVQKPVE